MKILTASQIRELDAYTIENEPIASVDLMERAGSACTEWIVDHFPGGDEVVVFCGPGNNGGDGLVVARLLGRQGKAVSVIYPDTDRYSADFKINLNRLHDLPGVILKSIDTTDVPAISRRALIVDAMFGSGLSRPLDGIFAGWVSIINRLPNMVVSIDIPSGLFADAPTEGLAIEADFTISLEVPKRAFFIPENQQYVGEWSVISIGLDKNKLKSMQSGWSLTRDSDVARLLKPRNKFDHKGTFGHALIIAGSYGKAGACILASKGALHIGSGLVTAHVPAILNPVLQTAVPEVMVDTDDNQLHFTGMKEIASFSAVGIGCGIGQHPETVKALEQLLEMVDVPLILDADALNIISKNQYLLKKIPKNSILTPHPREFERLFGKSENHFDRLRKQQDVSRQYNFIVVLKGAHTAIAEPTGHLHFNSTGNPGMATAGTGDVLTGILTGLAAQGIRLLDTAILGVYLHGLAGDLAAEGTGYESLIASDVIGNLGNAFRHLHGIDDISSEDV